jgi:ubiquinone/menaquinone biosynthesis C-methylase UbiE
VPHGVIIIDDYHRFGGCKKANEIFAPVFAAYPAPQKVLDVGCGTGYALQVLNGTGYTCTDVDGAEDMLRIARQENLEIRFESADATEPPFDDNSFNIVI